MSPRVSVLMPVYNGARFLEEAILSIRNSNYADFELLVLDDGSTDNSRDVATRAAGGDQRVRVLPLEHAGVVATRNAGLNAAAGEYVANLDSDDAAFPERLGIQVKYLDQHPEVVAVGSRALVVDGSGTPRAVGVRLFTHEEIDGSHLECRGGGIWNPTAMFRRASAMKVGGYRPSAENIGEDFDLWLRLAEVGRLANLREVLVRYRVHEKNISILNVDEAHRRAVMMRYVSDAFSRRGITGRSPERRESPPLTAAERRSDDGLLRYYHGDRRGALLRVLRAGVHNPTAAGNWHALGTILARPSPIWRKAEVAAPQPAPPRS